MPGAIADRCLVSEIGAGAVEGIVAREILPLVSDLVLDRAVAGLAAGDLRLAFGEGALRGPPRGRSGR